MLAILTNSFVPCNGRFPTLLTLITIFFVGTQVDSSLTAALLLTVVILLGVLLTFGVTWGLSKTILRGKASSFTLELPPYRRPRFGQVILRSMLDRTLFVLGRAAAVAAPAGLALWCLANVTAGGATLLLHCANILDPFARLMGLDGVILLAFILGFPANEIVVPIMLMAYLSQGSLTDISDPSQLLIIFTANGWTPLTAACTIIFSLFHWPCSTTLLTVRKETASAKWMWLAAILPTVIGMLLCMVITAFSRIWT
jgi:ferrous iron transport protein B